MPQPSKRPKVNTPDITPSIMAMMGDRSQLDFEVLFYSALLKTCPNFVDVLRALSSNLSLKGQYKDGLKIDLHLARLRPGDPELRYNLACRYALLRQPDLAFLSLRQAIELGYRDFRYMMQDRDLESIRKDPRFRQLLREFRE